MIRALCALLCLALAGEACASSSIAPSFTLTSFEAIEDMFAESDAVVLGRIEGIQSGMVPFESGFVWRMHLHIAVEQVVKGNMKVNHISLDPGSIEGLAAGSFERWRDHRTQVIFFLVDVAQRRFDRNHPDSAALAPTPEWALTLHPGYGLPVLDAGTYAARVTPLRSIHSIESLSRQADAVVLGAWERDSIPHKADDGRTVIMSVRVQRVLKGRVDSNLLPAIGRGFAVYPEPPAAALYFLRRQKSSTYEIIHLSGGVKPIRGRRLRQDGLSIDEAILRIQAANR